MNLFLRIFFIVAYLNHGVFAYEHSAKEASTAESPSPSTLVPSPQRNHCVEPSPTAAFVSYPQVTSFKGSCALEQDLNGDWRILCLELPVRQTLWKEACTLPGLYGTLVSWDTTFKCSKVTKGLRRFCTADRMDMGMERHPKAWTWCQTETETMDQEPKCTSTCLKRTGKRAAGEYHFALCSVHALSMAVNGSECLLFHVFLSTSPSDSLWKRTISGECRCGVDPCSTSGIPRPLQSSDEYSERCCQSREEDHPQAVGHWTSQNVQCGEQCLQGVEDSPRCQGQASGKVVFTIRFNPGKSS